MNNELFILNVKRSWRLWVIILLIMLMYKTITLSMYNPDDMAHLESMFDHMPEALLNAMNFIFVETSYVGFIAGYYYGFIVILFPMIYTIAMTQGLLAKYVDNGSMAYILATPIKRSTIVRTQAVTLVGSLFDLFLSIALIGIVFSAFSFPGELEIGKYLLLNLGAFTLFFALSGIAYFFACIFNEAKHALSLSIATFAGFFVIDMLASVNSQLAFLEYFTIFSLYNTEHLFEAPTLYMLKLSALVIIGIIFYVLSVYIFKSKDLTL